MPLRQVFATELATYPERMLLLDGVMYDYESAWAHALCCVLIDAWWADLILEAHGAR